MRSHAFLVASFVVVSISIRSTEAGYDKLNEYLVTKVVDNDEVEPNMEAASKWLEDQNKVRLKFITKAPIDDLRKFAALQQVVADTRCDRRAYEIMRPNEKAVGLHQKKDFGEVVRRVDKVMLDIFKKHAEKCLSVYRQVYRTKRAQLDEAVRKRVERLAETIIRTNAFTGPWYLALTPSNLINRYIKYNLTVGSFAGIKKALYTALIANSEGDVDAKYTRSIANEQSGQQTIHGDKIKDLIGKYLIEPCRRYEAEMGPDLFIPAEFEARVFRKIEASDKDYYLGWSYFKICRALTADESTVFDEVMAAATAMNDHQ